MSEIYKVEVIETSKELSAKQRIALRTGVNAISLDQATQVEEVVINPDYYAELAVHNEKSDDKDYTTFIIVDKSGQAYATGSRSFIDTFKAIFDEMNTYNSEHPDNKEEFSIVAFRMESKNYKGKSFITCRVN